MDIGFQWSGWRGAVPADGDGGYPGHPEWHELRARLFAARAARIALADLRGGGAFGWGSFDSGCARRLAGLGPGLAHVNSTGLGEGNRGGSIDADLADPGTSGDRG
jgi:hypothetical protein